MFNFNYYFQLLTKNEIDLQQQPIIQTSSTIIISIYSNKQ